MNSSNATLLTLIGSVALLFWGLYQMSPKPSPAAAPTPIQAPPAPPKKAQVDVTEYVVEKAEVPNTFRAHITLRNSGNGTADQLHLTLRGWRHGQRGDKDGVEMDSSDYLYNYITNEVDLSPLSPGKTNSFTVDFSCVELKMTPSDQKDCVEIHYITSP